MFQPLTAQPALIDLVHDRLVAAIADGTLRPGERLTQEIVATRLGVSRQPVSHALQILRRRGLAVETGKRGLIVAPLDPERLRHLYQVRSVLDGLAASLTATNIETGAICQKEREDLEEVVRRGNTLAITGSVAELINADVAFHSTLHRLSGNPVILDTIGEQWPHFMRSMGAVLADPKLRRNSWVEHTQIADAVLAGDAEAAEKAARHHMANAANATACKLKTQPSPSAPH
jgi:DNA-binding GntR family transcriptional regulator